MRRSTSRIAIIAISGTFLIGTILVASAAIPLYLTDETVPKSSLSMERAREIRQFAAREIDYATDREVLLDNRKVRRRPSSIALELMQQDAGGFWCAGTAMITQQLYKENGARSWRYDFGVPGIFTHVTTLVEIDSKVYVQDSYFNFEFIQADGTPMPLSQVMRSLGDGVPPNIRAVSDYERDWHYSLKKFTNPSRLGGQYRIEGNSLIRRAPLTLDSIHETGFSKPGLDWLEERGHPRDLAFLMLFPLRIAGPGFKKNYCISLTCPRILTDLSKKTDVSRGRSRASIGTRLKSHLVDWLP